MIIHFACLTCTQALTQKQNCVISQQVICLMLFLLFFPGFFPGFLVSFGQSQVSHFLSRLSAKRSQLRAGLQGFVVSEEEVLIKVSAMRAFDCDWKCDYMISATWSNHYNGMANQMAVLMGWARPPNDSLQKMQHELKLGAREMQRNAGYFEPLPPEISSQ